MRLFYDQDHDCIESENTVYESFVYFGSYDSKIDDFDHYMDCCLVQNNGSLEEIQSVIGIVPGMNLEENDIYYDRRNNSIVTRSILETEYNTLSSVLEDIDNFTEWIDYNGIILLDSFDLMMKSEDIFEFIEEF